jgi:acyl-CoA synthetase (AMP-forming)/AMP-acid ligase II
MNKITLVDCIDISAAVAYEPATHEDSFKIVGCGYPFRHDIDVVIVTEQQQLDAASAVPVLRKLSEGEIGEIWINSPSKAAGYWNKKELTQHDFHAVLADDDKTISGQSYLRTGDLGFFVNSELFICGRMKDMIIIRGANHYPQDIERTAEQCDMTPPSTAPPPLVGRSSSQAKDVTSTNYLRAGCSAAFAVTDTGNAEEYIVYVAEVVIRCRFIDRPYTRTLRYFTGHIQF